jgi:putative DNA methylase
MKIRGSDLFVGALAAALSEATKYNEIIEMKKLETSELMDKYILRAALYGLGKAISQKAHVEEGIRSNEGLLYLVTKFLYAGSSKKVVTSDDARIFSLGAGIDLSHVINDLKMFRAGREDEEVEGSSLAKRKMLVLLEPQEKDKTKLREFLYSRAIDIEYPIVRSSIDALHLLEYYTLADSREKFKQDVDAIKAKYPSETEEAIGLAKVISASFEDDTEGELCTNVIMHNQGFGTDLRDYSGGL